MNNREALARHDQGKKIGAARVIQTLATPDPHLREILKMRATPTVPPMADTTATSDNVTQRRRADDWKKPAVPAMTNEQLGIVLNDISTMAGHIERFTSLLLGNLAAGQDDDEAYLTAIGAMAQRIGWASDMACDRIDGTGGAVRGDAERWMMPPIFHYHQAEAEGLAA